MPWTMFWRESENAATKRAQKKYDQEKKAKQKNELIEQMLNKCHALGGVFPTVRQVNEDRKMNFYKIRDVLGNGRYERVKQIIAYRWYAEEGIYLKDSDGQPITRGMPTEIKRNIKKKPQVLKSVSNSGVKSNSVSNSHEEVTDMAKPKYTYADIWAYAREHDLHAKTFAEIQEIGQNLAGDTPSANTILRYMGPKPYWGAQVTCTTAEEAAEILRRIENGEEDLIIPMDTGVVSETVEETPEVEESQESTEVTETTSEAPTEVTKTTPEVITEKPRPRLCSDAIPLSELAELLEVSGFMEKIGQTCQDFSASWDVMIGSSIFRLSLSK